MRYRRTMLHRHGEEHQERNTAKGRHALSFFTVFLVVLLLVLPSCTSLLHETDTEERANAHMRMADSLERASALREAAFEYGLVVQHYPRTQAYPEALRKSALLTLQTSTSERSDSLSRSMLGAYIEEAPVTQKERESVETMMTLIGRLDSLRKETRKQGQATDSLNTLLRRQSSSALGQSQRIAELEQQLRQVTEELRKLKQVDLDISRNRRQKVKGQG